MDICSKCGEYVDFRHVNGVIVPIHSGGGCRGHYNTGKNSIRNTFQSKYTYNSFVNPNAWCPVCGDEVFFYQSPYGGRIYFDELGPPWPKHLCTDNSSSKPSGRSSWALHGYQSIVKRYQWQVEGWMPLICTKIVSGKGFTELQGLIDGLRRVTLYTDNAEVDFEDSPVLIRLVKGQPKLFEVSSLTRGSNQSITQSAVFQGFSDIFDLARTKHLSTHKPQRESIRHKAKKTKPANHQQNEKKPLETAMALAFRKAEEQEDGLPDK
jgi:hypothetical protein